MAQRKLRFSFRKNEIYDRRIDARPDGFLAPVMLLLLTDANVSSCAHTPSPLREKAMVNWVNLYRDLYMPQRAK